MADKDNLKSEMPKSSNNHHTDDQAKTPPRDHTYPKHREVSPKDNTPLRERMDRDNVKDRNGSEKLKPRVFEREGDRERDRDRDRDRARHRERSRSSSPHGGITGNPGNTLYVQGLSVRTKAIDIDRKFSQFGKVEHIHLVTDPRTEESRGFAFVTMSILEEAEKVIQQLHGTELDGRMLIIEKSRRKVPRSPTPGHYMGHERRLRRGPSRGYGYVPHGGMRGGYSGGRGSYGHGNYGNGPSPSFRDHSYSGGSYGPSRDSVYGGGNYRYEPYRSPSGRRRSRSRSRSRDRSFY